MRSSPANSERRRDAQAAGFTLLECVIATLVMTLMAYGWMRLHSSHTELVASLDEDLPTANGWSGFPFAR